MKEQKGVPYKFPSPRPLVLEASPQRAGHQAGLHPEDRPYQTDEPRSRFSMQEPDDAYATEDDTDNEYSDCNSSLPRSVRRYAQSAPAPSRTAIRVTHHRTSARTQVPTTRRPPAAPLSTRRVHGLVLVGVGMLVMLTLWTGGSLALSWWQSYQNDLHYGRPRTTQVDAKVGHDDAGTPSHFIAVNLAGHIVVVEFPGGDAAHAKVYIGPIMAPGHELDPVTLEFHDVNGDGKPDMIMSVGEVREVFINDNGSFRPLRAGEQVNL
jgi:hypothetical protein